MFHAICDPTARRRQTRFPDGPGPGTRQCSIKATGPLKYPCGALSRPSGGAVCRITPRVLKVDMLLNVLPVVRGGSAIVCWAVCISWQQCGRTAVHVPAKPRSCVRASAGQPIQLRSGLRASQVGGRTMPMSTTKTVNEGVTSHAPLFVALWHCSTTASHLPTYPCDSGSRQCRPRWPCKDNAPCIC
jgi:hypothetical protein